MDRDKKSKGRVSAPNIAIANVYTLIAGLCSVFFIIFFYYVLDSLLLAAVMGLILVGVVINYIILRRTKNYELAAYTLLSMGAVIMFSLFGGGWDNMGLIWPFAWLPATFWMNKGRGGRIFVLVFFTGCMIITLLHFARIISLPYSTISLVNFFAALAVFSGLMILNQNATIDYEEFLSYRKNLFEVSIDPFITVDKEGKIADLNKVTEILLGRPYEELIGSDLSSFFTEPGKVKEMLEEARSENVIHNFPLIIRNREEKLIDVLANASLYWDEKKQVASVFVVMRDISERKRSEEKIKSLNERLSQNVRQLESVNKDLESFSFSVSHDLRAPLRAISGFTQVLEKKYREKIDEEGKRLLDMVEGNAEKMGNLIDDLLAFSRLGSKEVVKTKFEASEIVKAVLSEMEKSGAILNAKITVKDLPPIYGDQSLIRQVFVNLLSNAIKFSREKAEPMVEVGAYTEKNGKVYYVKDNGVGFDMKFADKLFKVFQRLHSTEEYEGTGVGLAIVARIVERHGGRVWAEGKPGEGATFFFFLPNNAG